MTIAVNPDSGDVVYLGEDGQWQKAQTAVHPQTKQMVAYDGKDWVDVPAKSKGVFNYIDDAVRSLAGGATFGWADKLAAKANELTGSGTYEQNVKEEQARTAQIPGAIKYPGEIAGAVGGAIAAAPMTGAVAGATGLARLPALAKSIGMGTAGGAAFGAGEAPIGEQLSGAAKGAGLGAVVGGAAPYVIRGVGSVYNAVRGALRPEASVAADLGRAIARDEDTPRELARRAIELGDVRPGATIADAGGENVRGLVERIAQTPGAGRTQIVPALTTRQQGQLARVSNDLRELTGTHQSARQSIDETMASRKEAAAPLYKKAYENGDKAIWSIELERLTSSPSVQRAMHGAVRTWRDTAIADGFAGAMNPGALVDRGGQLSFTGGNIPAFPNLQFWDYTKRILDDQVSAAFRAGQNQKGKTLSALAEQLRNELDRRVPAYGDARNAWAGPSRYLDAIEEGRNVFTTKISADDLHGALPHMTDAEREGYRIGAISAIIGKMGNDPAKLGDMTKYLRSPEMREKVAALMPTPEARAKWEQRLNFEVSSSELTGRALGNSATARRLAEKQDADGLVGDLVMEAFAGSPPVSLLRRAIGAVPKKIRDTLRSRSDDILAELLTQPQTMNDLVAALKRVDARGRPQPPSQLTNAAAVNATNAATE